MAVDEFHVPLAAIQRCHDSPDAEERLQRSVVNYALLHRIGHTRSPHSEISPERRAADL